LKAAPFEYVRATSVAEACELLHRHNDAAKLIAGGQSLVPMMAMRLARPSVLVDINEIADLKFISFERDAAHVGAATRQCVAERDVTLAARVPLIRQALVRVGHVQTRNRGTVGGSLVHADPAAELPLVAQVLGARMQLRTTSGVRSVPAERFFSGPMTTLTRFDECLEEVQWPVWPERLIGSAFAEMSMRHGDFAIVAVAAQVALNDEGYCVRAAFGVGGAGPTAVAFPRLAERLIGTRLEEDLVQDVAQEAAKTLKPSSDLHASASYRRHLAAVLTARVLRSARDQARSER